MIILLSTAQRIKQELGDDLSKYKKITIDEIRNLGYIVSDRKLNVFQSQTNKKTPTFILYCLLDEDRRNRKLDFCYLYSANSKTGIIVNKPFEHFCGDYKGD